MLVLDVCGWLVLAAGVCGLVVVCCCTWLMLRDLCGVLVLICLVFIVCFDCFGLWITMIVALGSGCLWLPMIVYFVFGIMVIYLRLFCLWFVWVGGFWC